VETPNEEPLNGAVLFHNSPPIGVDFVQRLLGGRRPRPPRSLPGLVFFLSTAALLLTPPVQAQEQVPSTRIEFLKYESMATTVALGPNGTYIAIGARNMPGGGSRVILWNQITDERVRDVAFPNNRPPELAFDSSGTRLAVAPAGGGSSVWRLDEDRPDAPRLTTAPINDLAFGPGGALGVGATSGAGGAARVWYNGLNSVPAVLETERPVRSLAFSENTSDVILATGPTQAILWNYRFGTTKQFNTFDKCSGTLRQVEMSGGAGRPDDRSADYFYIVTRRRAACDPDYLCRIDVETRSVTERFRRKNIRNLVALGDERVAFSRGRHVYTMNLRTQEEKIVFASDNEVRALSHANGRLVVANSNVVVLDL
jgi:hypothetical protein